MNKVTLALLASSVISLPTFAEVIDGEDFDWNDNIQTIVFDLDIKAPSISKNDVVDGYGWDSYKSGTQQHKPDMVLEVNMGRQSYIYDGVSQHEAGKYGIGNMISMVCKDTYQCRITAEINRPQFAAALYEVDRNGLSTKFTKMATFSCDITDGECKSEDGNFELLGFKVVRVNEF